MPRRGINAAPTKLSDAELRKRIGDRMLTGLGPAKQKKMYAEIEAGSKDALDQAAQQAAALTDSVGAQVNADANGNAPASSSSSAQQPQNNAPAGK